MKVKTTLLSIGAAVTCFLHQGTSAYPSKLQTRAVASTDGVVIGYFPNWLYARYTPSQLSFEKYTHIYYAFAVQDTSGDPSWADPTAIDSPQYGLTTLIKLAHAAGTKVIVSVGGWSGSVNFSPMAASSSTRSSWIKWNVNFIQQYGTDGVDIDWEYPTNVGAGCNAVNDNDVDNLQLLVAELRAELNSSFPTNYKEISLAVHITPFGGAKPVTDVSGFVPHVDRFHIMAFDVNGAWNSTSGPNAPFNIEPGFGYPAGFVSGIAAWHKAGVPYNKIVGGVAFYGRSQTLTGNTAPTTQYNTGVSPTPPSGDKLDGFWQDAYCAKDSAQASGIWRYYYMRANGTLLKTPTQVSSSAWVRHFDNTTQTPWLYNKATKDFISYDDPISIGVKAKYIVDNGLGGAFIWSSDQDYQDELLDALSPILAGAKRSAISSGSDESSTGAGTGTATTTATDTSTATATSTSTGASTKTKTSTGSSNTDGGSTGCSGTSAWSSTTAYEGGQKVTYQSKLYTANWWSQGETPDASNTSGPWKLSGSC